MYVKVLTTDNKIWNQSVVFSEISYAMSLKQPFTIDFLFEGPDLRSMGFYETLSFISNLFQFPLSDIKIITSNALEHHDSVKIVYHPPIHLVENAKKYHDYVPKNFDRLKHFGIFINRSNPERLLITSYVHKNYSSQSIISYHFNVIDDFHTNNIGLDNLIRNYNKQDLTVEAEFLKQCPIRFTDNSPVIINKNLNENPAQQLLNNDREHFIKNYQKFFLEIVCESYYSGRTFFPTEKIFRPMVLKTPFIVQGPMYFLHRLRDLGFKTFSDYWDEGYSEDSSDWQLKEIIKVIDFIATKSTNELISMHHDMKQILDHNYQRVISLTQQDYHLLHNEYCK